MKQTYEVYNPKPETIAIIQNRIHYKKVGVLADDEGFPYNPRGLPGDVSELEEEIEKDGQRTPLSVTEANAKGIHITTRGHRRKKAIDNLRAKYRKLVREYAVILEELADSTSSDHHNAEVIKMTELWNAAKAKVELYSYYNISVNGIDPTDLLAVLRDMDAGVSNKPVDPIAYGETMLYRMDKLGWTFQQCYESLSLNEAKARACVRAADPKQTAESVRTALRTGEMSLTQFVKKISRLDMATQARVMDAAAKRAEGKNASGVISPNIINAVIADLSGEVEQPGAPDADVLPLLAQARDNLYAALKLRNVWSEPTRESASWLLEEMIVIIQGEFKEQERGA